MVHWCQDRDGIAGRTGAGEILTAWQTETKREGESCGRNKPSHALPSSNQAAPFHSKSTQIPIVQSAPKAQTDSRRHWGHLCLNHNIWTLSEQSTCYLLFLYLLKGKFESLKQTRGKQDFLKGLCLAFFSLLSGQPRSLHHHDFRTSLSKSIPLIAPLLVKA